RSRWTDGSATFTIVTSRTIISCARHTTASVTQRWRFATGGDVGAKFMAAPDLSGGVQGAKMEATSEISGGILRYYTEGHSTCQGQPHEHDRGISADASRTTQAGGRAAQLREGARGGAQGLCRGRRVHGPGGD